MNSLIASLRSRSKRPDRTISLSLNRLSTERHLKYRTILSRRRALSSSTFFIDKLTNTIVKLLLILRGIPPRFIAFEILLFIFTRTSSFSRSFRFFSNVTSRSAKVESESCISLTILPASDHRSHSSFSLCSSTGGENSR